MIKYIFTTLTSLTAVILSSCESGDFSDSSYGQYSSGISNTYTPQVTQPVATSYTRSTKSTLGHGSGPSNFRTVIIDAGHGGMDTGASVYGVHEKHLALDVAKRVKQKLSGKFNVVLLRSSDYFIPLDNRVSMANRYNSAVMVSIHLNHSYSRYARGPETYYFRVDSHGLAKRLQQNMARVSPRETGQGLVRRRLRLTRNPKIPCVLVELGYLSSGSDRSLLTKSYYRDRMATAIANALITQDRIGDSGTGSKPAPLNRPMSRPSDTSTL